MIFRFLQLLIFFLWLGTTFFLVRRAYFPDENYFKPASIDYVSDLFFGRVDKSDLVISQDGKRVSFLSVTPNRPQHLPTKLQAEPGELLEIHCFLLTDEKLQDQMGQIIVSGSVYVDPLFQPQACSLALRAPHLNLNGELLMVLDPADLSFRIRQAKTTLLSSDDLDSSLDLLKSASALSPQAPDLSLIEGFNLEQVEQLIGSLEIEVDCRHGQFRILGDRYEGYILQFRLFEGVELRLYLSELGELLRIDGIPNIKILGEAFVPQG